jgi:uncharacterized repeat protein (TIGR01451 family)
MARRRDLQAPFLSRLLGTLALGAWLASSPVAQAATDLLITALPGGTHPTSGIVPGQTVVNIEMAVFNQGANAEPAATVSFPLTPFCTNITWTCTTLGGSTCTASGTSSINDVVNLPASSIVDYNIQCTVLSSVPAPGIIQAMTVTASLGDTDNTNNSANYQGATTPQADVAITKTDGVTTATPGGSVTYTITASNAGPSDSPGTNVFDPFPIGLTATWTCAGAGGGTCSAGGSGNINDTVNLPAGASVTYTASGTIDPAATGTLSNTAFATASVTDTNTANNSATDTDTLAPQADLAITKTDGVTTATPGGSVTYTITASNAGPSTAIGATVADTLPASLTGTWTCVGAGGGTCTASGAGNINDTVNLPAGASVSYTVSATVSAAATGSLSNTATVTAPAGVIEPNPGNNSATDTDTLVANADLAITLTDGATAAAPGGTVTYTITASNAGPSNVTGATVADTFPASLTVTWTCTGAGGGTCTGSGAGNINDTVNLPVGASVTYTASASVSSSAAGTLSNTATVTAPAGATDPNPGNNSATDTDSLSVVTFSGPSATGTGTNTAHHAGPASCTFSSPQFIGPPPGSPPVPPTAPPGGVAFPEGLFDFSVAGCPVGATVTLSITYPQPLPAGSRYWKYGPTSSNHSPHWYNMPATITSNTATFSITDGGLGDDDLTANGIIDDQGGPGAGAFLVPTLDIRALALLVLLLLAGAAWTMRRRGGFPR